MQARIKVIKRGEVGHAKDPAANEIEKTDRQRERETATMVKGWIAEWEARNRALKNAALLLVHSLDDSTQNSTRRFAVSNG